MDLLKCAVQPTLMIFRQTLSTAPSLLLMTALAVAQAGNVPLRIAQPIDEARLTVLKGNTHPLVGSEFDRGPAPSNLALGRMLLVLQRSPEQEKSLRSLLDEQQQKSSSNYHAWLTPDKFGQQFGIADQDIHTVTSWLSSHGFQIGGVAQNRMIVEFSGTAGQVKEAFHTEIHQYEVNGKKYWANSTDPGIPAALTPVVAGIASLHNFGRKPTYRKVGVASQLRDKGQSRLLNSPLDPVWTEDALFTGNPVCGITGVMLCYGVAPYDFATIYNVLPLWNAASPINGTGQTIAIVSQSEIYQQDFDDFRNDFGLPAGTLNFINNGQAPGFLITEGDELETDIDVELSGAVAPGATIDVVISASTNTTAGIDLSALYIVDNNLAPVMSESYGACELEMGTAGNQFYNQLWQQAAAQGITVFVSAGDSGSAGCDQNQPIATQGLAVNGIASTPYDVAVGGTDFDDLQNPSTYWSSTNNPVTQQSALSYIPEMTWNDNCTNSEFFSVDGVTTAESDCNDSGSPYWGVFQAPIGGSGGVSSCTTPTSSSVSSCSGGYTKPSWQTGMGVPNDGKRDVPDVSLFSADGLNASFYVVCQNASCAGGDYQGVVLIGGTSAAAPEFAGIMALVNQKTQSRQGLANYSLYSLAAQPEVSCNSSGTLNSSCIFYDVTLGTNATACATGSPNCVTNVNGDQYGVLTGYNTTAGYDLATGLGSVNVANLVNNWGTASFQPTVSTLSLNPTTQITHGALVNLNIVVAPETGTGTPSGMVSLMTSAGPTAGTFMLANGDVSSTTSLLPGGSYTVTAHYAGDGTYAGSDSSPGIAVTVSAEPSVTTLQAFTQDQNGNVVPYTSGTYGASEIYLRTNVAGQSGQGVPTGTINLTQTLNGITTNLPGNPYALNSEAYATAPLPGYQYFAFSPGSYSLSAKYSGDSSFEAGTSPPVVFTVTQASTSTTSNIVGCGPNGVCTPGGFITFFAFVNYTNSDSISYQPTGTVTFFSNGTPLTSPIAVDSSVAPPVASFTTTQPPLGNDTITAQYSGDSNYVGSTSGATAINAGGTFTVTASPIMITIAGPGQSGSTTLTFSPQNGLTGSGTLSPSTCVSLPAQTTCSFSPSVVTFNASTASVPVTLTISTTAASSLRLWRFSGPSKLGFNTTILACVASAFLLLLNLRRHCPRSAFASLAAFMAVTFALGCGGGGTNPGASPGGGGGGGGGGGSGSTGTPPGNFGVTLFVTINGVTQVVNNLSVNVQ